MSILFVWKASAEESDLSAGETFSIVIFGVKESQPSPFFIPGSIQMAYYKVIVDVLSAPIR